MMLGTDEVRLFVSDAIRYQWPEVIRLYIYVPIFPTPQGVPFWDFPKKTTSPQLLADPP